MLLRIGIRWVITAIAVAVAVLVLRVIDPTWITLNGTNAWLAVVVMAAILGLVNAVLRPILAFLSCGCIIATFGLFVLVINGFTLWLAGQISATFNTGFSVNSPWAAFWGAIVISAVSFVLNLFIADDDGSQRRG